MTRKLPKHATSIGLVVLALTLGGYVWWIDRDTITDTERSVRERNIFPAYRRDALERIELVSDAETMVLERDVTHEGGDAVWRLSKPAAEDADGAAVDKLLGVLEFATYVRKVEPGATTGFDAPRVRGTIVMGKVTYRFVLGSSAPTPEGAAYLRLEGEGDYVVTKELADALLKTSLTYRSRTVVPYLSIDLARLEVKSDKESWAIRRTDEVAFRMEGDELRASREALDKVWGAFAEMRAEGFLSDADAARATEHPAFTIVMTPKDAAKPKGELVVGGPCPALPDDVVVVRKAPTPLAACVPKLVVDGLGTPKAALLDTKLFLARPDEAEELVLEPLDGKGVRIEIARKGSGWHQRAPVDRDLAGDEVDMANALVGALTRGLAADVRPIDPNEPFTPHSRAKIVRFDNQGEEIVELGTDAKGAFVAHRLMDHARLSISKELARRLAPTQIALRGRAILSPPLESKDVTALSTRCGVPQDLTRGPGGFVLVAPAGYAADSASALDLVDAVARATAEAWIAETDDGSFGLGADCELALTTGPRVVKLRFGKDGDGGVYAQVEDRGVSSPVFVIARPYREAAARILVDRTPFALDPSRADEITLVRDKARVTLRRVADRLVAEDGGLAGGADPLVLALGALHADEVVRLGPPVPDEGFAQPSLEITASVTTDAGARKVHLVFGRATVRRNQPMYFARVDGTNATFVVVRERVDPILSGF